MSNPCPVSPNCGDFPDQLSLAFHLHHHTSEELTLAIMKLIYKVNLQ